MKVFGISGFSGNGKTTLIETLIPCLTQKGFSVSSIKHTHHKFDMDKKGKDSFRHREAGAKEVMLASNARWALLHELHDEGEPEIEDLLKQMAPVDLVLIEGFKRNDHPKLEVYRPSYKTEKLWPDDKSIVVVASDDLTQVSHPEKIDLNKPNLIADFIVEYLEM